MIEPNGYDPSKYSERWDEPDEIDPPDEPIGHCEGCSKPLCKRSDYSVDAEGYMACEDCWDDSACEPIESKS